MEIKFSQLLQYWFSVEILEMKGGFKYELNFNKTDENSITETLTWAVDNKVLVPAHFQTVASVVIEEKKIQGSYELVSRLSGT
jgi:hypothetical protein